MANNIETSLGLYRWVVSLCTGETQYTQPEHVLEVLRGLQPWFEHLLERQGKDPTVRQQLQQTLTFQPPDSPPVQLSQEDVKQVILLSDALNLSETKAVSLLLKAVEENKPPVAKVGGGIYFEEREHELMALWTLLQMQATDTINQPEPVRGAIDHFVVGLLKRQHSGRSMLLARILQLIKECDQINLDQMPVVVHRAGQEIRRDSFMLLEKRRLCECLAFSASLLPSLPGPDVKGATELLFSMAHQLKGAQDAHQHHHHANDQERKEAAQQHSYVVLVALLYALVPLLTPGDTEAQPPTEIGRAHV